MMVMMFIVDYLLILCLLFQVEGNEAWSEIIRSYDETEGFRARQHSPQQKKQPSDEGVKAG